MNFIKSASRIAGIDPNSSTPIDIYFKWSTGYTINLSAKSIDAAFELAEVLHNNLQTPPIDGAYIKEGKHYSLIENGNLV